MTDFSLWRRDFPAVAGHPERIYFDNAATTQKPQAVIDEITAVYTGGVTAAGRTGGNFALAQAKQYEQAQRQIARYFGAQAQELIITKSATEALNLVAVNIGRLHSQADAVPTVALARHNHSSVLAPFEKLALAGQLQIQWLDFDEAGRTQPSALAAAFNNESVCLVALPLVSNVFGVSENLAHLGALCQQAKKKRRQPIYLLVDAAAAVLEQALNFDRSGIDFLVVSAHKMFGPHLGGLMVKAPILHQQLLLPQLWGGGNVIYHHGHYQLAPEILPRWRAGVPDLALLLAWAQACQWWQKEQKGKFLYLSTLTTKLEKQLRTIPGIQILGQGVKKHLLSFMITNYSNQDVAAFLATQGVLLRQGEQCAQMLYAQLQLPGSLRFSLAPYNTEAEVTKVVTLLERLPQVLSPLSLKN